ncbi:MAG: YezD family protein [Clostridia bacterium]|jgi:hypothetical protein|nr:YezD family protein [Clostridia bacterium]
MAKEEGGKGKTEDKAVAINKWGLEEKLLEQIIGAIKQLKYGTVTIVIQDSKVIQIDRTEKMRLG